MDVSRRIHYLLLTVAGAVALLAASGCAGPLASASGGTSGVTGGVTTAAAGAVQSDWRHTLQVVADLRADPPTKPVVYLLGGSVARECVVSEASWAKAVRAAGGPVSLTYDLSSSNRTTAQDLKIVAKLPATPAIVFIGLNVGRFTPGPSTPTIKLPPPSEPLPTWDQHHYTTALSTARKRALVTQWMQRRYPLFKQHYTYDLGMLAKLIRACKAKGFHPVLLDLPRNRAIIGHAMDAPVTRYHRGAAALAAKYGIPFVDFVAKAGLVNSDFHDLWHLLAPGRAKWQPLLARHTATLLKKYGLTSPSASPSP